jgi:ABC-type transport system involved in cytochrome c biogenesis permease subunit
MTGTIEFLSGSTRALACSDRRPAGRFWFRSPSQALWLAKHRCVPRGRGTLHAGRVRSPSQLHRSAMKKILFLSLVLAGNFLARADELDFSHLSRVVVQADGRKKPLDTFAAESLQIISGRRTWHDGSGGRRRGAMDFLCSVWFGADDWKQSPVLLVSDHNLRKALGLGDRERLYSPAALQSNIALKNLFDQVQSKRARQSELTALEQEAERLAANLYRLQPIVGGRGLRLVPHPTGPKGDWSTLSEVAGVYGAAAAERLAARLESVRAAYLAENAAAFAKGSRELSEVLRELAPAMYPPPRSVAIEVHYNQLHPFRWAWILYLAAFFVLLARRWPRAGLALFIAGLTVQTYGFVLRCLIAGRPPVTNMYESLIWVSLGVAGLALGFQWISRSGVYLLTAAPLAVLGLIVADLFPAVLNPDIGPLPPVLRDNFWLTTHVLTITLSYAAFALAMGLGHVILAAGLVGRGTAASRFALYGLLDGVLKIGLLLLAAGTILGGVWANYSWGRFWGWDPKETWALIAFLLYIFAFHGRIAGWWGNFGLSVAAIVCFNGVLMAWYGVNFVLGKGLHSYGFAAGGTQWIAGLVVLDLIFVAVCIGIRSKKMGPRQNAGTAARPALIAG